MSCHVKGLNLKKSNQRGKSLALMTGNTSPSLPLDELRQRGYVALYAVVSASA